MKDPLLIWSELEADTSYTSGYVRLRIEPDTCCDLFLAVSKPENSRSLLLEVNAQAIPPDIEYPQSDGFQVILSTIKPGPDGQIRIILQLSNERYSDVFSVLAGDIVAHVAAQHDQKAAIAEFISRLVRWQTFFRKHPEGLGEEAQKGLYGELWFLRTIVIPSIGDGEAVRAWVGPTKANQDFQFDKCAIEIKTTSGINQPISITNIRQLDDAGIDSLILLRISLDVRLGGVQSLNELVEEIRTLLHATDAIAAMLFDERLLDVGYLDIHQSKYMGLKYTIRNYEFFQVISGFPRILEQDLMPGIADVRYSIAVASCMPFKVSKEEVLKRMVGGG
jgi:hypothetical protein